MIKLFFLILMNVNWDFTHFWFFMLSIFFERLIYYLLTIKICWRFMHSILILWRVALLSILILLLAILNRLRLKLVWLILVLEASLGCFILSYSWWRILLLNLWSIIDFWSWDLCTHIHNSWDFLWFCFWAMARSGTKVSVLLFGWIILVGKSLVNILWFLMYILVLGLMRKLVCWIHFTWLSLAHLRMRRVQFCHALIYSFCNGI